MDCAKYLLLLPDWDGKSPNLSDSKQRPHSRRSSSGQRWQNRRDLPGEKAGRREHGFARQGKRRNQVNDFEETQNPPAEAPKDAAAKIRLELAQEAARIWEANAGGGMKRSVKAINFTRHWSARASNACWRSYRWNQFWISPVAMAISLDGWPLLDAESGRF